MNAIYKDTALPQLIDPEGRFGEIMVPVLDDMGYRLIRVAFNGSDPKRGAILQVMIEPNDGSRLLVDACKFVSNELSAHMDVADPINDGYVLEVGSAGLDKPLTDKRDYDRFKGWEAKIEMKRANSDGQRRFRGFLKDTSVDGFALDTTDKGLVQFAWGDISSARLVASDELLKALQNGTV
jgi:ribosome maturation factor RimP